MDGKTGSEVSAPNPFEPQQETTTTALPTKPDFGGLQQFKWEHNDASSTPADVPPAQSETTTEPTDATDSPVVTTIKPDGTLELTPSAETQPAPAVTEVPVAEAPTAVLTPTTTPAEVAPTPAPVAKTPSPEVTPQTPEAPKFDPNEFLKSVTVQPKPEVTPTEAPITDEVVTDVPLQAPENPTTVDKTDADAQTFTSPTETTTPAAVPAENPNATVLTPTPEVGSGVRKINWAQVGAEVKSKTEGSNTEQSTASSDASAQATDESAPLTLSSESDGTVTNKNETVRLSTEPDTKTESIPPLDLDKSVSELLGTPVENLGNSGEEQSELEQRLADTINKMEDEAKDFDAKASDRRYRAGVLRQVLYSVRTVPLDIRNEIKGDMKNLLSQMEENPTNETSTPPVEIESQDNIEPAEETKYPDVSETQDVTEPQEDKKAA